MLEFSFFRAESVWVQAINLTFEIFSDFYVQIFFLAIISFNTFLLKFSSKK